MDFTRHHALHEAGGFFLIRAKRGLRFKRRYSQPVDRMSTQVLCDQIGTLEIYHSRQGYPGALRRVLTRDEHGKRITFLTNNTSLAPETVGELYRLRWQVELFFKWIKQHLRTKAFFGTSENAVKTQIWIAIATYVLIAILKKRATLPDSLYELLQVLSLTMFETTRLNQLLTPPPLSPDDDQQLVLL
jgi:Transposase DDE domain